MILGRHILRAHVGPFLFSNAVIVFLFLLQFLMKSAGDIVGKGLSIWVVLELISLNLAWILVLSVPMSVLVATLMAFGNLSSTNEVVIMRASGMSLYRMLLPVFFMTGLVTWGLILFNNRVLPEANIRLRTLMTDILRIKPTLSLQAGVFTTDDQLPNYRILVRKTFEKTNDLEGVTIYDLSRPEKSVVVTAAHGSVAFSPDYSKVIMDLRNGEIHEIDSDKSRSYRTLRFSRHRVSIPASGFGFQRSDASSAQRDDRTMSAQMMEGIVDSISALQGKKQQALHQRIIRDISPWTLMRHERDPADPFAADAFEPMLTDVDPDTILSPVHGVSTRRDTLDAIMRVVGNLRQSQAMIAAEQSSIDYDETQVNKYLVEVYKKYSIPAACLVFVLIGAPLGMMARRGGFGVGAGISLGFFLFYWAFLIGGEKLADRNILTPFVGMWAANMVLGTIGVLLAIKTARETWVIDWSVFTRLIPRAWRVEHQSTVHNPHES
ncbi:MAG: LptF/LptG family permease [Ignavibacteriae bacterium]|nr:LptF/LptG family permease [Ignavibacteriota bacterium]